MNSEMFSFGGLVLTYAFTGFITAAVSTNIIFGNFKKRLPIFIEASCFVISLISMACLVLIAPGISEGIQEGLKGGAFVHAWTLNAIIFGTIFTLGDIFVIVYFPLCWRHKNKN